MELGPLHQIERTAASQRERIHAVLLSDCAQRPTPCSTRVDGHRSPRPDRGSWHTRGVIAIYPLLLIWAAVLIQRTERKRRAGWRGFATWSVAGAVFTFSLLPGLSI